MVRTAGTEQIDAIDGERIDLLLEKTWPPCQIAAIGHRAVAVKKRIAAIKVDLGNRYPLALQLLGESAEEGPNRPLQKQGVNWHRRVLCTDGQTFAADAPATAGTVSSHFAGARIGLPAQPRRLPEM